MRGLEGWGLEGRALARVFALPATLFDGSGLSTTESSEVSPSEDDLTDMVQIGCFLPLGGMVDIDVLGGGVVHIEDLRA